MDDFNNKITDLKAGKNPRVQRSNIYLNGKYAFSLDNEVIAREKLKVGTQLSADDIKKLVSADDDQVCLHSAFKFLSYRPRSEAEIREKLMRKGYGKQEIERTIAKLKSMKLLNDVSFAEFWKENRNSFRPRSRRVVSLELRGKGVETEVIQQVVSDIDDVENAYKVAVARARTLSFADFQIFRQKLGSYLQRRGFNYGVINNTVKRVWQERSQGGEPPSELFSGIESPD